MTLKKGVSGIWTALVTPFDSNGKIDWPSFRELLSFQKISGVHGVVVCGTTGESPTLSQDEKKELILATLTELNGSSVQVYAGTGSNDTKKSIEFSQWASEQGVQGVLIVTPYYNRPSPQGIENHFRSIAESIDCDIMLYNIPSRAGVGLSLDTLLKVAQIKNITSLKDATGNLAWASEIISEIQKNHLHLSILSGDDPTFWPLLSIGGQGVVSVASNLIPKEMVQLYEAFEENNLRKGLELHQKLYPFFQGIGVEVNPVPIKNALFLSGLCKTPSVRSPLAPLLPKNLQYLSETLRRDGLLRNI